MAKHTINGWLYYKAASKYSKTGEPTIVLLPFAPQHTTPETWGVPVREHSIEVEIPDDFDPRPQQVAALRAEQQKVRAAMSARILELDKQIQSLLAIEKTVDAE